MASKILINTAIPKPVNANLKSITREYPQTEVHRVAVALSSQMTI
jgi:hypothetical protein